MTSKGFMPAIALLGIALASCAIPEEAATTSLPVTTTVLVTTTSTTEPPTTTTSVPTTTTAAPPTTVGLPPFPPEQRELEHGGYVWVVVLAAAEDYDDPALDEAVAAAEAAGYHTGPTDCDHGASEALGLPEAVAVSVYLRTEADAHAALEAFLANGVNGAVARVQTFCLD